MKTYSDIDEMRSATDGLTPAQLFDALYSRMNDVNKFGDEFAQDPVNGIVYTRLRLSLAQEVVRLLMSCVRADAAARGEDVATAIDDAARAIQQAVSHGIERQGFYD